MVASRIPTFLSCYNPVFPLYAGTNVKVSVVPFVYVVLPVQPCVALPETRVVVDVPLLEPKITNWPEELIDHVSPVTFIPTPDKVPLALKVRVPPVTVKLLPLNIAVVKTLPVATGVNVKVSVVPLAYPSMIFGAAWAKHDKTVLLPLQT
jgi:hypothetical protein